MSRQASPAVVGGFVIGGIALIIIGVLSFGGGRFLRETHTFVLYFEGSLSGLSVGSPVMFRGVKVGRVSDLIVRYDSRSADISTPVYIQLEDRIEAIGNEAHINQTVGQLVERGLRAQLALQSLITGQLSVQLDLHENTEARFVGAEPRYPEIPTIPSAIDVIATKLDNLPVEELVESLLRVAVGVDDFIRSADLKEAVTRLNTVLEDTSHLARNVDSKIDPITDEFVATSQETRAAVKQLRETVVRLEDRVDGALRDLQNLSSNVNEHVTPLATNLGETMTELRDAIVQAKSTMATLEGAVAQDSQLQYRLGTALDELAAAARAVRELADYLERHPEALLRGKTGYGD